ncbi:MAG: hypothetical protein ACPGPF_00040 [Pontibacterium sp.]
MTLTQNAKNAMLLALAGEMEQGGTPRLELQAADSTVLATLHFPVPLTSLEDGAVVFNAPNGAMAMQTGDAATGVIRSGAGTVVLTLAVGAELQLDNTQLVTGSMVNIPNFALALG